MWMKVNKDKINAVEKNMGHIILVSNTFSGVSMRNFSIVNKWSFNTEVGRDDSSTMSKLLLDKNFWNTIV